MLQFLPASEKNISKTLPSDSLLIHTAKMNENLYLIAKKYMSLSNYLFFKKFLGQIKKINDIEENNIIQIGQKIKIPIKNIQYSLSNKKISSEKIRGIYLSTYALTSSRLEEIISKYDSLNFNAIVLDFKNTGGKIFYPSKNEIARKNNACELIIQYPEKLISFLHSHNISLIARVTIFKDTTLAAAYPEFRPIIRKDTTITDSTGKDSFCIPDKIKWCNPNSAEVQQYNIDIIKEIIELGVDEIQLDYIRFPTESYLIPADYGIADSLEKKDVITNFVKKVYSITQKNQIKLSADIFGVVVLQNKEDIQNTGQDIVGLEHYLDRIHPMIYPSHFSDKFWNKEKPYQEPYFFIYRICKNLQSRINNSDKIIPYLEAFTLYEIETNALVIISQLQAAQDSGLENGFLFWNANSKYDALWEGAELWQSREKYYK